MNPWHWLQVWISLACLAAGAAAQTGDPAPTPRKPSVVILGASVSAGFSDQFMTATTAADRAHNFTLRLAVGVTPLWAEDAVTVRDVSNLNFFQDPSRIGRLQVDRAVRAEADLVLAVDYLFWFGYSVRGGGKEQRLALQREGLEQLARIEAPLLVGDYPEMGDVDPRMMPRRAVPDAETLVALNANLRAWAKDHQNVRVFALATMVDSLRTEPREVQVDGVRRILRPADLLQTDRLHATRLGMAVLVEQLGDDVRAMLPGTAPARPRPRALTALIEDLSLEELAASTPKAVPVPGAGKVR